MHEHPPLLSCGVFVKQVESVVGLRNGADEIVNVTAVCGSLNNPLAFNQFWQNFSYQVSFRRHLSRAA